MCVCVPQRELDGVMDERTCKRRGKVSVREEKGMGKKNSQGEVKMKRCRMVRSHSNEMK